MLFDSITSGRLLIVCELYAQPLDRGPYITGTIINRPDLTVKASPPLWWGWRDGKCLLGIGQDFSIFDFLTPHKGAFKNQPDD